MGAAAERRRDATARFHVQCESGVSVTGSNADLRLAVAPSELGAVAVALLAAVGRRVGDAGLVGPAVAGLGRVARHAAAIERTAEALVRSRGESLVVSGSDDVATQIVVAKLNAVLGNTGATVDLARPSLQRQGDDTALPALIDDMNRGTVHALLLWGANPVYDHPDGVAFRAALQKVALSISFADRRDETSAHVHAVCPDHHFLEAWGDAEPVSGHFSLRQPLIAPLHDTRAAEESLLTWAGRPTDQRTHLRAFWKRALYKPTAGAAAGGFEGFWERALERGVIDLPRPPVATRPFAGDLAGSRPRDRVARQPRGPAARRRHQLRAGAARDRRRARRPPRQQPVAAGAARSDDAPDLGQRRVASRPRPRRRWASRPATSSR